MPDVDIALRALTDDDTFRVIAVRATDTVQAAIAAQKVKGPVAQTFAELVTGAVLIRETMAPDLRLQALLQTADRSARMVADAFPRGETRGLVINKTNNVTFSLAGGAILQLMRTLHDGSVHQGTVAVPDKGGVSGALMQYLQQSEQVASVIAVRCVFAGDQVLAAGGYIVQLLPGLDPGPLMLMAQRLEDFEDLSILLRRGSGDPKTLLDELLYGMPYTQVGDSPVLYKCQCSELRVTASLATLPRSDIEDLMRGGKPLEISCEYCGHDYQVRTETLRGLLAQN
jgi:molecular chaperone Hsp33